MTLRVLMLNNEFPPLGGGTGTINENIIRQLAAVGDVQIDLVTSSLTKQTYEVEHYLPGVRCFKVPVNNKNIHHSTNRELLAYTWHALFLSTELIRQSPYDICLAFCTVPAGGVALGLWYMHHLPFLVRVSGPDIPGFEERYNLVTKLLVPFICLTWRKARRVIVKCTHEQAMVASVYSRARIMTIPNAVDLETFQPALSRRSQDETIRLLCVARLIERKGQHHLLEAARLLEERGLRQFKIVLVGTGDAEAALKVRAHDLGVEGRVEFRGYVPRGHMPQVYATADVFALPSFNEGMSVATLEAMATGLPLVVTRASGLEDLVDRNGFTFLWGDVVALADALEQLIQSAQLRQQMGEQSRQIAQQFSWREVGQAYFDLLSSCVESNENRVSGQVA